MNICENIKWSIILKSYSFNIWLYNSLLKYVKSNTISEYCTNKIIDILDINYDNLNTIEIISKYDSINISHKDLLNALNNCILYMNEYISTTTKIDSSIIYEYDWYNFYVEVMKFSNSNSDYYLDLSIY